MDFRVELLYPTPTCWDVNPECFQPLDKFPAWKNNLMVGSIVRGRTNGASGVERVVFNEEM
jgi:hypothetical protein